MARPTALSTKNIVYCRAMWAWDRCRQVQNRLPAKAIVVASTVEIVLATSGALPDCSSTLKIAVSMANEMPPTVPNFPTSRISARSRTRRPVVGVGEVAGTVPRVPGAVTDHRLRWRVLTGRARHGHAVDTDGDESLRSH